MTYLHIVYSKERLLVNLFVLLFQRTIYVDKQVALIYLQVAYRYSSQIYN